MHSLKVGGILLLTSIHPEIFMNTEATVQPEFEDESHVLRSANRDTSS